MFYILGFNTCNMVLFFPSVDMIYVKVWSLNESLFLVTVAKKSKLIFHMHV